MYNRYLHAREESKLNSIIARAKSEDRTREQHQKSNSEMDEKYKERVRNFLVSVISRPIVLGQYIPPVKNIVRNPENSKIIGNPQLYINGFKTNRERIKKAQQDNCILDLNPTKTTALLHQFRERSPKNEIQPGMRFQGRSASTSVLPKIENRSEVKLRYKGIEELGNDLRSMRQTEMDKIGLENRLQTVAGGQQLDHRAFSMLALRSSKLLTTKYSK